MIYWGCNSGEVCATAPTVNCSCRGASIPMATIFYDAKNHEVDNGSVIAENLNRRADAAVHRDTLCCRMTATISYCTTRCDELHVIVRVAFRPETARRDSR